MSSDAVALSVRELGKAYTIVHQHARGEGGLGARLRHALGRGARERFWALRDVSFDVAPGEVVGIIGHNGAGKSTLLKLLSRITAPTRGEIHMYGRVGSLLEVGTGFHRELTGRENIYLNGAILGMRRREIDRRFDEIVDFAGTEKFLDTPVKRYSSGMFVRLAFAVAAHLEPEILIVDEVLAVGDADFQKKCLGKMQDVARHGRTVLFVSHNMATVQSLCSRAVLLAGGEVTADGPVEDVVRQYLDRLSTTGSLETPVGERTGTGSVYVTDVRLLDAAGQPVTTAIAGEDLVLAIDYANPAGLRRPMLLVNVYTERGAPVTSVGTELTNPDLAALGDAGRLTCRIPRLPLLPGRYRVAIGFRADGERTDYLPAALVFDVGSSVFHPTGRVPHPDVAAVMVDHAWEHAPRSEVAGTYATTEATRA